MHNGDGYCGKLLHLNKGFQCSLHYHPIKHETFVAIKGKVFVETYPDYMVGLNGCELGEKRLVCLRATEYGAITIPPNTPHRFWTTNKHAILAEFSTTHSDEDVVRIEESRAM